jgi:uncharacterized protein YbaR (Trm112 family)
VTELIRRLLDILVCPFDKESSLELYEFSTRNLEKSDSKIISETNPQNEKLDESIENKKENIPNELANDDVVIEEGILFCNSCSRFYPIVEEIPIILPDELRDKNKDLELMKKWSDSLPEKVVNKALPWHL